MARISALRLVVVSEGELALRILEDTEAFPEKGLGLRESRSFLGNGRLTATSAEWHATHRSTGAIYQGPAFRTSAASVAGLLEEGFRDIGDTTASVPLQPRIEQAIMQSLLLPLLGERQASAEAIRPLIDDIKRLADWTSRRLSTPSAALSRLAWTMDARARRALARLHARIDFWRAARPEGTIASLADRTPAEARFELLTLLLAGFETTAATTAFAIDATARSSVWADALRTGRDPAPVARAIIAETLRLHPPVWAITRRAKAEIMVGGRRFRGGDDVLIDVHGLHRDPAAWAEPDRFDPRRFLNGAGHPAGYIPFGHGARQCIGRRLGIEESAAILAWLFSEYRIAAPVAAPAGGPKIHAGLAQRPARAAVYALSRH